MCDNYPIQWPMSLNGLVFLRSGYGYRLFFVQSRTAFHHHHTTYKQPGKYLAKGIPVYDYVCYWQWETWVVSVYRSSSLVGESPEWEWKYEIREPNELPTEKANCVSILSYHASPFLQGWVAGPCFPCPVKNGETSQCNHVQYLHSTLNLHFWMRKIHRIQCSWVSRVGNKSTGPFYNVVLHLYEQCCLDYITNGNISIFLGA